MIVDIVDKYCTDDNNPIKKPTLDLPFSSLSLSALSVAGR
jgi:hypothetical protein